MNKLELITASLIKGNIYAPGETITAEDYAASSDEFDLFIDKLNTKANAIFTQDIKRFSLVAGQQIYTIGPSGDFNTTRPQQIQALNLIFSPGGPSEVRRPMNILNYQQWSQIRYQNASGAPLNGYPDGDNPVERLYLYPIPDQAYDIELYVWQLLTAPAEPTTTIVFPPGYKNMFIYNLAERLCSVFSRAVPALVAKEAAESRIELFGFNAQSPLLSSDPALTQDRGGLYNYLIGQYE